MIPVLGREIEEGQQRLPVLRHALDGLGISGLVFVDKNGDGNLGGGPVRRVADLSEIGLHVRSHRFRHLVEHVEDLVLPAALMTGRWKGLPDFDQKVISMYARGMSVREIRGHLPDPIRARLAAASVAELDTWLDSLLDATSLEEVFRHRSPSPDT